LISVCIGQADLARPQAIICRLYLPAFQLGEHDAGALRDHFGSTEHAHHD
jgi:hypothetical protein